MTIEELQAQNVELQTQLADAQKALTDAKTLHQTEKEQWGTREKELQAFNQKMFETAGNIMQKYGGLPGEKEEEKAPTTDEICSSFSGLL